MRSKGLSRVVLTPSSSRNILGMFWENWNISVIQGVFWEMRRRMKGLLGGALAASSSSGLSSHYDDPPREQQSTGRSRRTSN